MAKPDYSWTIPNDEMALHRRVLGTGGYGEVHEVCLPLLDFTNSDKIYNVQTGQVICSNGLELMTGLRQEDYADLWGINPDGY